MALQDLELRLPMGKPGKDPVGEGRKGQQGDQNDCRYSGCGNQEAFQRRSALREQADEDRRKQQQGYGEPEIQRKKEENGGEPDRPALPDAVELIAVELIKEKAQQQIQYSFAMNAGCPKQGRWQEEDSQGRQWVGREVPPEYLVQPCIPHKEEEVKKKGIDVDIVSRKKIEQQLDKNDTVVRNIGPFGIVKQELCGVIEEPLPEGKAPLVVIPDIAMPGVVPPRDQVVHAADGDVEGKERQQEPWPDTGFPEQRKPYETVAACDRI